MRLRHVCDSGPGILRQRHRGGFRYRDSRGRILSRQTLERIRKLAIPPAWEHVWICPAEHGHLQATGRDARGRKQYRYHAAWVERRGEEKYSRLSAFARTLPQIRGKITADLARPGLSRVTVLAAVVRLLDCTHLRIGNDEYARSNKSFGLCTLQDRHAVVVGSTIRLKFNGKSGIGHERTISGRRLAAIVRGCRDLPGQDLFQYRSEDGKPRSISSGDVNQYIRTISGGDFTAKDFRTWAGTVAAAKFLSERICPEKPTGCKRVINEMLNAVSQELGNTPAICRKCYVDPRVVDAWLQKKVSRSRTLPGLSRAESHTLRIISR